MLTRLKLITILLSVWISACELTDLEQDSLTDATDGISQPGGDFDQGPLEPNCYAQKYRQPEAEFSKKVDLLFMLDTSGSINGERQQIGEGVDAFLAALPQDVDANIAVSMGHIGNTWTGKLYRKKSDRPYVFKSSEMSTADIKDQLGYRMRYTKSEGLSDGGEAGLYSLDQMLNAEKLQDVKDLGFMRDDAALVVVFVADENAICARYPEGVTRVYDSNRKELPAFDNYCENVTPESVLQKLKLTMGDKPFVVSGILYNQFSTVPNGGENEIGYGYIEMIEQANGAQVDLSGGRFHIGLEQIANLAVKKLNLKTEFQISTSLVDTETLDIRVDNSAVPFSYVESSSTILLTNYAGIENSEIYIGYCEPQPEPELPAPVIAGARLGSVDAGSALVLWETDISSTSQLEITKLATGEVLLTDLDVNEVKDHSVFVTGLTPNSLYQVVAISIANEKETRSEPIVFRTSRTLN
ncbi:MAG: hypothetical protein AB8E15_06990 [Bdellovibrionales bacterium]